MNSTGTSGGVSANFSRYAASKAAVSRAARGLVASS